MLESKETFNLDPIIPLTENPQHYLRLREAEKQRFAEHAQRVKQANQEWRHNERQQFQERILKCPIGVPPKPRLSPRSPPSQNPEFKQPMMPNQSPQRQHWQGDPKKQSPDLLSKNSNSTMASACDAIQPAFQASLNNYRMTHNNFCHQAQFQDPRLMAHPYQFVQQKQLPPQYNDQFNMAHYQHQQQLERQNEFLKLQMFHQYQQQQQQQQQWQASQLQRQQMAALSAVPIPANPHHSPPTAIINHQFPNQLNNLAINPSKADHLTNVNSPPQMNDNQQFKGGFWPSTQPPQYSFASNVQNDAQMQYNNGCVADSCLPPTHPINFTPSTPPNQQPNELNKSPKDPVLNGLLMKNAKDSTALNEDDDTMTLFSTIGEEGMEHAQMIHQYLDSVSDIQTCNFPQITTNTRCDNGRQTLSSGMTN